MLLTNFKSAWRNLLRNPFSSFINIAGLATGIICCIFISLYVWSELQADEFHVNKKNLFRVNQVSLESGRAGLSTSYPFGTALKNEYREISRIVRLGQDNVSIRAGHDSYFYEDKFYWADSSFFKVFSFPLVKGDPATALKDPYSLVMTEAMAEKYFKEADPLGKTVELKIYDGDRKFSFTVTGVVKDLPENSTIQFQFLAPMHAAMQVYPQFENFWNLNWVTTYALVSDPVAIVAKEKQSAAFFRKYAGDGFSKTGLEFQPMSRLHLYSGHVGKNLSDGITNVYVFAAIGIFIFLLACVNFVNISTARAELRKKEIGVRKALGAFRQQIFIQFMAEAVLTAAIVLVIAFAAVSALQPLAGAYIEGTSILFSALALPLAFFIAMILISLFAGLYPAAFLSGFKPMEALKARAEKVNATGFSSRQLLVVFQFTISIALIAGTLIINKQVRYLKQADLGMTTGQIITIPVDDRDLQKKITSIRDVMAATPGVTGASATGESFPAAMNNTWNISWPGRAEESPGGIDVVSVDYDYFDLLQVTFAEGRNLSRSYGTDDSAAFIINEAARAMMGMKEAVGKEVTIGNTRGTIIGVVKDIHHYSLHQKVEPIAYFPVPAPDRACSDNLILKISPEVLPSTIASLKQKWEGLTQDRPFEYHFVDDEFARTYAQEEKFLVLFEVFSGLAIIIACLGLMGLSSFVVNKRSKEIGIRKVLGASIPQILLMLTRGFSIPIFIAFLFSGPGVYYVMTRWLDRFAYKVNVDLAIILLSGVLAWAIAFCFIGYQSWQAARINPVNSLKDE
jgi:putative ABC transport system permease protein